MIYLIQDTILPKWRSPLSPYAGTLKTCCLGMVVSAMTLFMGCADVGNLEQLRALNRQNLSSLTLGMSRDEVTEVMGANFARDTYSNLEHLTATNPYTSEVRLVREQRIEILYYYTDSNIKRNWRITSLPGRDRASPITELELSPVVLQHGKVIGWGRRFLKDFLDE